MLPLATAVMAKHDSRARVAPALGGPNAKGSKKQSKGVPGKSVAKNEMSGKATTKSTPKKTRKKIYCCNPYTFWCFRDHFAASVAVCVALVWLVFIILLQNVPLPVPDQPCPHTVTSLCNDQGQYCDQYSGVCSDNAACAFIDSKIQEADDLGETYCGQFGECMQCNDAYATGSTYEISVVRCGYNSSEDREAEIVYREFYGLQEFTCANYSDELIRLAQIDELHAANGGVVLCMLFLLGAIVYYFLLSRSYSLQTGKPRMKWVFAGEVLKPKPRCCRRNKRGNAPILGGDLSIETHYKDLFKHPWACRFCQFANNDPGTSECEVCRSRNPFLPPTLTRWVDTELGQLTEGKLRGMAIRQIESHLKAVEALQFERNGGIETPADGLPTVSASASPTSESVQSSDLDLASLKIPHPGEVQSKKEAKPTKKQVIETLLQRLEVERQHHEKGLEEQAAQRRAAERAKQKQRAQFITPKFSGIALSPSISLGGGTVALFQTRYDVHRARGAVAVLANRVWVRARQEARRAQARLQHLSAIAKTKVAEGMASAKEKIESGINKMKQISTKSGQDEAKIDAKPSVSDATTPTSLEAKSKSDAGTAGNVGITDSSHKTSSHEKIFIAKQSKTSGALATAAATLSKAKTSDILGCGINAARQFQQTGHYVFLRGDVPDRYKVTRVRVRDHLHWTEHRPFAYKAWQIGHLELPRAAPTSHAAVSMTSDGSVAVFISHIQIIRIGPAKSKQSDQKHSNNDESKSAEDKSEPSDDTTVEEIDNDSNKQTPTDKEAVVWADGAEGPSGQGWEVATDVESGHQYEYCAETGETKWIVVAQPQNSATSKQKKSSSATTVATEGKSTSETVASEATTRPSPEEDAPANERIVLRCICNAVSTTKKGKYIWSTPLRSDPIEVPSVVMNAEAEYKKHKLAQTGDATEDSTDDAYSPLRKFETECLSWLQTPTVAPNGLIVQIRMHDSVRVLLGCNGKESPRETHAKIVEIDPDSPVRLSHDGFRSAARSDGSIIIWDVQNGERTWSWHNTSTSALLTEVDDEITALTGGVKAWEGGAQASFAARRPIVPDPGALQAFPFWKKIDKGAKPVSLATLALRLADLRTLQRRLWPSAPVLSGDGTVVAFRDQNHLYIVDARKSWEATKSDDGNSPDTGAFRAIVDLGDAPTTAAEAQIGISRTGGVIVSLVKDGAEVHAYNADGEPLWVHKTPNMLMGPTAPLVAHDGSVVVFKLWSRFIVLNGSTGKPELVGQAGDMSGGHQSMFELACCCLWRRGRLRQSFVGTQDEHDRGSAQGNMDLAGDGSALVVKSGQNALCFSIPKPYRS